MGDPSCSVAADIDNAQCSKISGDDQQDILNDSRPEDQLPGNVMIPETPSPSMPRKNNQQHRSNGSFDIAKSIFCNTSSQTRKGSNAVRIKEQQQDMESSNSSTTKSNSLLVASDKHAKSLSSSPLKDKHFHASKSKLPNFSSNFVNCSKLQNRSEISHLEKSSTELHPSSSSSGSDDDIPLLQRIRTKRKQEKKSDTTAAIGRLNPKDFTKESGKAQVKYSTSVSEKHSAKQDLHLHVSKRDLNFADVPRGKRTKVDSESPQKDNCFIKNSLNRDVATRQGFSVKHKSTTGKSGSHYQAGTDSDRNVSNLHSSEVHNDQLKYCVVEQRNNVFKPGLKTKKKTSPNNSIHDHKKPTIQKQIQQLFGSDTESDSDDIDANQQTKKKNTVMHNWHSIADSSVMRKNKKSAWSNHILSDDSTDTEPDGSVLVADRKGRQKCNRVKMQNNSKNMNKNSELEIKNNHAKRSKNRRVRAYISTDSSDDSTCVEMEPVSPEKSPVFNRTWDKSPVFHCTRTREKKSPFNRANEGVQKRVRSGTIPKTAIDKSVAKQKVSRTTQSRKAKRLSDKTVEYDVVTVDDDDEDEVVPQHLPRRYGRTDRRSPVFLNSGDSRGNSTQRSFELASRLSGVVNSSCLYGGADFSEGSQRRSELGTQINMELLRPSPFLQPGSSFTSPGSPTRRHRRQRNRESNSSEEKTGRNRKQNRVGKLSSDERRERQSQLEADEQFARDLASGRIRTPVARHPGKTKKVHQSQQMVEDEALARDLANGTISTPVGHQMDDDEALARRLQEQFNAEAMVADNDQPDMHVTTTTHVPGQYPYSFHFEMGMPTVPPYPSLHVPLMEPVVFGAVSLPPPPMGRRRGRARGRTRATGRRTRNAGVHIQYFPMDTSLDDDYESLWELSDRVGPAIQQGLTTEMLSLLPTFRFKPDEAGGDNGEGNGGKNCTICMMDYEEGDDLRRLPCFHDYHTACIDRWLMDNSACPVCQTKVTLDEQAVG